MDFPQPEGPAIEVKLPGRTEKETSFNEMFKQNPNVKLAAFDAVNAQPVDLTQAAENSLHAVVHIRSTQEAKTRTDLRNETIVTIDGDDAKDLDDAISLRRLKNGNYYLGVHIADVSYYVEEGSELDKRSTCKRNFYLFSGSCYSNASS